MSRWYSVRAGGLTLALAAGLLLGGPQSAYADHRAASPAGYLYTKAWTLCIQGSSSGVEPFQRARAAVSATDVNATTATCTGPHNLTAVASTYPDAWYGLMHCVTWVDPNDTGPGKPCKLHYVQLNLRTAKTTTQRNKTALHEFGHVGGLEHRDTNSSCMSSGAAPPISASFDAHDKAALNAQY